MGVSVVVPVCNEWENVRRLFDAVAEELQRAGVPFEIIFVDDGSTDGSHRELALLADDDPRVRVIEFRRNFGQTAALAAGIRAAGEDVIVTLDGDLQNDPADIPPMLDKLNEGYDLVHGWRRVRKDAFFRRRIPSRIANWIIARATGYPAHDLGCGLKVMRRDIANELPLYGEMHRFIPVLAHSRGARCAEVVTRHHRRQFGKSKYGLSRTLRVLFDLITVKLLLGGVQSPMRLFGGLGLLGGLAGVLSGCAAVGMASFRGVAFLTNPLTSLSAMAMLFAMQCIGLGLLGELGVQVYYQFEDIEPYAVRRTRNLEPAEGPTKDDVLPIRAA